MLKKKKKLGSSQVIVSFNKLHAHGRLQNLSEKEKDKKRQYCCEGSNNLSEDKKQRLVEYRRNYYIALNK